MIDLAGIAVEAPDTMAEAVVSGIACGAIESTGAVCTLNLWHDSWHYAESSDGSGIIEWRY